MTTPNEEVDDLYARLDALVAERDEAIRLKEVAARSFVEAREELHRIRAVLTPSDETLQNLGGCKDSSHDCHLNANGTEATRGSI